MKPSRFAEERIIGILQEQEAGAATADICRKHGISTRRSTNDIPQPQIEPENFQSV
jgi:hypothetical protein